MRETFERDDDIDANEGNRGFGFPTLRTAINYDTGIILVFGIDEIATIARRHPRARLIVCNSKGLINGKTECGLGVPSRR